MIDYISITKHLSNKDTLNYSHLQLQATYNSGMQRYYLDGCNKLEVHINNSLFLLKIKGSIAYYYQGHNFIFSNIEFVEAINYIGKLLDIDLWDSMVEEFEYGIIIQVETKPQQYIQKHRESKGLIMNELPKSNGCFRFYQDKNVTLKMYDAGKNIKHKQGTPMKKVIEDVGWNPNYNYLKWEVHYKRPHFVLNKGVGFSVAFLVNPKWVSIFKADLLAQYKRLIPMKSIIMPTSKTDLTSADIVIRQLAEDRINQGQTLNEVKKELYKNISLIPDNLLTINDRKARKRQIKSLIEKIEEEDNSQWDLFDKLSEKINE